MARAGRAEAYHSACVEPAKLLVLDEEAIAPGRDPNRFSTHDVNAGIAAPGLRKPLPFFAVHSGTEITLPSGEVGDEGWFALKTPRISWRMAGPDSTDGMRNYVEAGPGLGRPDAKGKKESLLEKVGDITPLRATGLAKLVGKSVCAVVMDGDVRISSYSPLYGSLKGANLGKVAFQVLSVGQSSKYSQSRLPPVKIRILDAETVCDDRLSILADAPAPKSYCEPRDQDPPACSRNENLLVENWDMIDPEKWEDDGEGMTEGGLFFAKDGSSSAVADWIHPCPVPVDSTAAIRFSNRIQFSLPVENDFAESGALFFVNAGDGSSFDDHVFVNVGYTVKPSKVFVELFGADGGQPFDQFMESSLAHSPSQLFNVDLWIGRDSYRVALGGENIDTVQLATPLSNIALFEVGVQQNSGGLRGFLDQTTIASVCESDNRCVPRKKDRCEPRTRCQGKRKGGTTHSKSDHSRCHHARYKTEVEKQKITRERERDERDRDGYDGDKKKSSKLHKKGVWSRAVPNPCGRNELIRMAKEKVMLLADPPMGLQILSRMEPAEGCAD